MTVRMIEVKHRITGRKTSMSEASLEHFTDYTPTTRQARADAARTTPTAGTTTFQALPPLDESAAAGKKD